MLLFVVACANSRERVTKTLILNGKTGRINGRTEQTTHGLQDAAMNGSKWLSVRPCRGE